MVFDDDMRSSARVLANHTLMDGGINGDVRGGDGSGWGGSGGSGLIGMGLLRQSLVSRQAHRVRLKRAGS